MASGINGGVGKGQRHEDKMCNQCAARAFTADGARSVCVMGPLAPGRLRLGISLVYANYSSSRTVPPAQFRSTRRLGASPSPARPTLQDLLWDW
jgi:hypothetical protein